MDSSLVFNQNSASPSKHQMGQGFGNRVESRPKQVHVSKFTSQILGNQHNCKDNEQMFQKKKQQTYAQS